MHQHRATSASNSQCAQNTGCEVPVDYTRDARCLQVCIQGPYLFSNSVNNKHSTAQHHTLGENGFKKLADTIANAVFLLVYLVGLLVSVVFGIMSFILLVQLGGSPTAVLNSLKHSPITATFAVSTAATLVSYVFGDYCQ